MTEDRVVRTEGSRVVQGCLFGAVLLFALLLITMVFLAIARMREMTAPDAEPTPAAFDSSFGPRLARVLERDSQAFPISPLSPLRFAVNG